MKHAFFIVGPTATGKSELAADVSHEIGAEIVSADAFQIYRGLDLLTANPDGSTLAKTPHHMIGTTPLRDEMNAEKYRRAASRAIDEINSRCKLAIVAGGSGLYIKALTHGLAPLPESDLALREKLNAMSLDDLCSRTGRIGEISAARVDDSTRCTRRCSMRALGWVKGVTGFLMALVFALGVPALSFAQFVSGLRRCGHGAGRSALVGGGPDWGGVGHLCL